VRRERKPGEKNGRAKSWGRKEREGAAISLKPWIIEENINFRAVNFGENPLFACLEFRKISNNKAR